MQSRQEINLIGGGFQHSLSTSGFEPKYITWVKGYGNAPISIHVDEGIKFKTNKNTKNYAWLCESKTINGHLYDWCRNNIDYLKNNFIFVFTHDVSLTKISEIFILVQSSGKSFIENGQIYEKNKLVSMIASNKLLCAEHFFRRNMIEKFSNKCDHYGRGFKEINDKVIGLKDYCFSITMENGTYPNMFTEKITDCFMTGTIPIYYGIRNIGDFFNSDVSITLGDHFKIEDLSFELYKSKINAVIENFKLAKELLIAEDYIYINHIKNEI